VKRKLLTAVASAALGWLSASAGAQEPPLNPAQTVPVVSSAVGTVKPTGPLGSTSSARHNPLDGEPDGDQVPGLGKGGIIGIVPVPPQALEASPYTRPLGPPVLGVPNGFPAPTYGSHDHAYGSHDHANGFHDPGCADTGGGLSAGVGIYILRPFFSNNPAITTTASIFNQGGTSSVSTTAAIQSDFRYDYSVSPRLWLGYSSASGLGARLSWWRFDQTATFDTIHQNIGPVFTTIMAGGLQSFPPAIPGASDVLAIKERLMLDVWDFDITQQWRCKNWWLLGGGGVRLLDMSQSYNASLTPVGVPPGFGTHGGFHASNNFDGAGPTLFLQGQRALGQSGFGLYASARGAVLFGSGRQTAITVSQFGPATGVTFSNVMINQGSRDSVLPVVEGELGAQWARQLGNYNPFLRVGVVGMNYFNVGSAAANPTSSFLIQPNSGNNANLGFFGLTITTGINF
jgi:hypothetical protein